MPDPLFQPVGDTFEPSPFIRGPWSFDHCHAGPPAGLLTTLLADMRPDMAMTRITCEIPAPIPLAPVRVTTETVRAGRRISLLRAEMTGLDGTLYMSAAAWMMRIDESVVGPTVRADPPLPQPHEGEPLLLDFWGDEPDFSSALEIVSVEGTPFGGSGKAAMWTRMLHPMLPDRTWNPYAAAVTAADFPNGIAGLEPMRDLIAVNTDLTVYFGSQPEGEWIGIRSQTNSSGLGLGMTDSLLYDASGFIGTANQSIYFDRPTSPGTA